MLSTSTLDALGVVISNLDSVNASIAPVGDSPFQNIAQTIERTTAIKDFNEKMFKDPNRIDFTELSTIAFNLANANDNESEMNLKMDEFVDAISTTVMNNVKLAKTVILPKIAEVSERVTNAVNAAMGGDGLGFDIVVANDNSLINSDDLKVVVEKYDNRRVNDSPVTVVNVHKERDYNDIMSLVKTGKTDFDTDMVDYFKDKKDFVTSVYYNIFLQGEQSNGQRITDIYHHLYDFNAYLLIFLITRGFLMGQVDETVKKYTLSHYRALMSDVLELSGAVISIQMKAYQDSKRNKRLVVRYPEKVDIFKTNQVSKIMVVGEVYEEYLASGGKPEAILGSALDKRYIRMEDLLNYNIDLIKSYNTNLAKLRMTSDSLGLSALRNTLSNELNSILVYQPSDSNWQALYHEQTLRINDYVAELDRHYLGEIPRAVKRGICQCLYPNTDVLTIIDNIEFIDPEGKLPINDVVALAIIDWIVGWALTEQLEAGTEVK